MPLLNHQQSNCSPMVRFATGHNKGGFALVIALSLMSLVVLLLLTSTTFVREETTLSGTRSNQMKAELAAVLSIQAAVAELQRLTGPDQRVTARADILNSGDSYAPQVAQPEKSRWTGVWNSASFNPSQPDEKEFLGWLASGIPPSPSLAQISAALSDQRVTMVGDRPLDSIQVERVSLGDGELAFAWVVVDEGVKANVTSRTWEEETAYESNGLIEQALRFGPSGMARPTAAVDPIFTNFMSDVPASIRDRITGMEVFEYTALGNDLLNREFFHDFTISSFGVLSNTREGGLKKDLSRGLGNQFAQTLQGRRILGDNAQLPVRWDVLRSYYNLFRLLDNSANERPIISPVATIGGTVFNDRPEFNESALNLTSFEAGLVNNWTPTTHPIAPVVKQIIWRIGGLTSPYFVTQMGLRWDWDSEAPMPAPRAPGNFFNTEFMEEWAIKRQGAGRMVLSPLIVIWNPYNVALDVTDYRVMFNPDVTAQWFAKAPGADSASASPLLSAPTDMVSLWRRSGSLPYSNAFSLELLGNYDRGSFGDISNPGQTFLQPGEMKIFNLYFELGTFYYEKPNNYDGGIGGYGGAANEFVPQLIGPQADGTNYTLFRTSFLSRDIPDVAPVRAGWLHDRLELSFGSNLNPSNGLNDFRLTLALSNHVNARDPGEGYVVRDIMGLRPNISGTVSYPFERIFNGQNLTFYRYFRDLMSSNNDSDEIPDSTFAASIVVNLKTSDPSSGENTVPFLAQYNPLAWHTRASHRNEQHSPIWNVRVYDRMGWSNFKNENDIFGGFARGGNSTNFLGQNRVVLKEIPRQPLWSVGQFMHSDIGIVDTVPLYTVGGSYAPPFGSLDRVQFGGSATTDRTGTRLEAADLAFLFNQALFDGYFFSTIPETGQSLQFPPFVPFNQAFVENNGILANSRMRFYRPASTLSDGDYFNNLNDFNAAAGNLLVDGAFNVNSTSVNAWIAFLSSLRQSQPVRFHNVVNESDSMASISALEAENPLPRFLYPQASNRDSDNAINPEAWAGFRSISNLEMRQLAEAIVEEVKSRGPFLSMSDFVNRRLTDGESGKSGALQAALDRTVNVSANFGSTPTESSVWSGSGNPENFAPASGAGAPGWILQNDILQALAPVMTVRSDTFRIRGYGEFRNPTTGVTTRVWCEAVVQRVPDWVDSISDPNPHEGASNMVNATFGRDYRIIEFRWLNQDQI
jgi:hypothetical protein